MRVAARAFVVLVVLAACAAAVPGVPVPGPAAPRAVDPDAAPQTVPALVYRRLAISDDLRDQVWIDEVFVPSERIAFSLDSTTEGTGADWRFVPVVRAFSTNEPPPWTEDIHGTGPVVRPETRETRVPAEVVARIRDWVRAREALERDARSVGDIVDEARLLPPGVGSRWWRPDVPPK